MNLPDPDVTSASKSYPGTVRPARLATEIWQVIDSIPSFTLFIALFRPDRTAQHSATPHFIPPQHSIPRAPASSVQKLLFEQPRTATDATLHIMSSPPTPPDEKQTEEQKQTQKEKVLAQATAKLEEAQKETEAAQALRERAEATEDPEEKKKILAEAAEHEKKAQGSAKQSKRLQSGVWQGGIGGAGIGAGLGTGLGAGVGTLVGAVVGGVTAIPTTGLGLLVGAGTGAIHGPWYKLEQEKKEAEEAEADGEDGEKSEDGEGAEKAVKAG
ncbi:hypothetical protein CPAR01_02155 [Colletotrichum paranaense]|uniref:Uncharacterized protein n=2 Tax=Colletotrichum acutatum species complex TaxID=2707335 RepID=A0ABQ9SYQ3_9PEZI|nr:uncharacterized protein CPAR01_02155 [Colletotrichum paranaense]KAK1544653.1 hypothetical protein CPAR01_02155 [Colletotrichum paranaense]